MTHANLVLRHVLRSQDFTRPWLDAFFPQVRELKKKLETPNGKRNLQERLRGRIMFPIFYEPSTRTRFSFCSAAVGLGMHPIWTEDAGKFSSAAKGESFQDTAHNLLGYCPDVIVMRHFQDGAEKVVANISDSFYGGIPVINAGSGKQQHPTQALLDLYTIWDILGRLDNLTVVIGADVANGRTCRSLAYLLSKYSSIRIIFVTPPELQPPHDLLTHLTECGAKFELTAELTDAIRRADVLYWVRLQSERVQDPVVKDRLVGSYSKFRIDSEQVALLPENAIILHPMPIIDEVALDVKTNCPKFRAYEQSANGLPVRMALLWELLKDR